MAACDHCKQEIEPGTEAFDEPGKVPRHAACQQEIVERNADGRCFRCGELLKFKSSGYCDLCP